MWPPKMNRTGFSWRTGIASFVMFEILLLALQFILGMYVNLFVTIPQLSFGYGMMDGMMALMFTAGMSLVMLHMFIGMIIGVVSIFILVMSLIAGASRIAYLSVISLGFVTLAGINGILFLFGGQNNVNSFAMAVSFLVVLLAQFFILYYTLDTAGPNKQSVR